MPTYPAWTEVKKGRPKLYDVVDVAIGRRVKARRKEMGIAICWMADVLKVTNDLYNKFEGGRSPIKAGRIAALCQALEMSPNELIGYDVPDSTERSIGETLAGLPGGLELCEAAIRMNPDQRNALGALLKRLVSVDDVDNSEPEEDSSVKTIGETT